MTNDNYTILYVLTNPSMPNICKIGRTDRESIDTRLRELYTTGVPVPFECYYAAKVNSDLNVEKNLHAAFEPSRVNPSREFFEIDPEQAKVILEMLAVEDVTPQVTEKLGESSDSVEKASADRMKRKKRPSLDFYEMGIPEGSTLEWAEGGYIVTVSANKKVIYDGSELSLTKITKDILGLDYSVQPTKHWVFNGKNLEEIYNETFPRD